MWIIENVDVVFLFWITAKFPLYYVSSQTPLYYVGDDGDRWSGQCMYWRHICRHTNFFWYVMFALCVFAINWTTCSMPIMTGRVFKYVKLYLMFAKLSAMNLNQLLYSFAHFADKVCIPWWLVLWHVVPVDVSSILGTMISLATSQQRKHSFRRVRCLHHSTCLGHHGLSRLELYSCVRLQGFRSIQFSSLSGKQDLFKFQPPLQSL